MAGQSKRNPTESSPSSAKPPRRIETQIHRRSKAKATSPLQAEWDEDSGEAPQGLRMPEDRMNRRSEPT